MKLETISSPSKEIYIECNGVTVTANCWSNFEGVNIMMHSKDLALRLSGALRWEEVDALLVALTAARAA